MQLILFDDRSWENLLPLTFTRPVSGLRVGILTIAQKWEKELGMPVFPLTRDYLRKKFPCTLNGDNLLVNSTLLPDRELVTAVQELGVEEALEHAGRLLAVRMGKPVSGVFDPDHWTFDPGPWIDKGKAYGGQVSMVDYPWKIFELNGREIEADFQRLTAGRKGKKLSDTVEVIDPERVFVEPGFKGEYFTLNASTGPIYLGAGSEIMEGSVIRGPFALCEGALVKLSAKIYGPTTIGPFCRVAGEIKNAVFQANSNKGHDGFLGNSVLGEWCNLGADTNNSNLKNNYSEVKIWNYASGGYIGTGNQFMGLIMGDHSKCGINTMFNTGTVVGVSANIFGAGFPPKFVPSFSWGGAGGFTTYRIEKMLKTAGEVMKRRETRLSEADIDMLRSVYNYSEKFRNSL